jgi:hypothetical protein
MYPITGCGLAATPSRWYGNIASGIGPAPHGLSRARSAVLITNLILLFFLLILIIILVISTLSLVVISITVTTFILIIILVIIFIRLILILFLIIITICTGIHAIIPIFFLILIPIILIPIVTGQPGSADTTAAVVAVVEVFIATILAANAPRQPYQGSVLSFLELSSIFS